MGIGETGETIFIKISRVKPRIIRVLTHVTVENLTSDYTKARLGINHGGTLYYLNELQTIKANELAVSASDILLGEGDVFFSELTGTTDGNALIMTCVGWEMKI